MSKHNLNVSLGFTANTSQVKAQLQDLQNQLSKLSTSTGLGKRLALTPEIKEATKAAMQLEIQLKNATNPNTGKLDLGRFNESMQKSGMSLSKYQQQLAALGPEGDRAFASLAMSITQAEIPLKRANKLVADMWDTMKNTARWQISSSTLNKLVGTMQSAYGYAKDLDRSLNDIRIVTGNSAEEMADFAVSANKAAKALSTTTTAYTDAALIYYQQGGMSQEQIEEKANITLKMANVARIGAEEASQQLTAIWNNFDDGSQSLEHYADVLVKLGAETASSSDEISEGIQKFAAIGQTVGLTYESAAAALATVTATTRESAEVVGTAFKTIFARIQGLELGDTLEDGTTLNKYSEALNAVGINIKDQYGELKDMDDVLAEMGAKWSTISKDQQVALAQTVAGVRQYNQLMALMENWDFYEQNLESARNAEGALEQQAEIYAESWEASRDRVKAAAEGIYGALIDREFFTDLNDFFAGFLGIIEQTIQGLGGVKGVLLTLGTVLTQVFQKQIAESLGNFAYGIKTSTKKGFEAYIESKKEANRLLIEQNVDEDTTVSKARASAYISEGNDQLEYLANAEKLSQEETAIAQKMMDRNRLMGEMVVKSGEELENEEKITSQLMRQIERENKKSGLAKASSKAGEMAKQSGRLDAADEFLVGYMDKLKNSTKDLDKQKAKAADLQAALKTLEQGYKSCGMSLEEAFGKEGANKFANLTKEVDKFANGNTTKIKGITQAWSGWTNNLVDAVDAADPAFNKLAKKFNLTKEQTEQLRQSFVNLGHQESNLATQTGKLGQMSEALKNFFRSARGESTSLSTAITQTASAMMSIGMAITSVNGLIDIWNDKQKSLGQKLTATLTTLGTLVPTIMAVGKSFQGAALEVTIFGVATKLAMWEITLIVAAVAALIGAFAWLAKEAKGASLEGQFERSKEAAQALKSEAEKTKTEVDGLFSAFDRYDNAVKALGDCVQGTEEWNNALREVNNSVLDLINDYPQLAKYKDLYSTNENGMLELNADIVKQAKEDAERSLDAIKTASIMKNAQLAKEQNEIDAQALKKKIGSYGAGNQTTVGGVDGTTATYFNKYVKAGDILTKYASELSNLSPEDYRKKLTEILEGTDEAASMTTEQFDSMVEELMGYQDSVDALGTATDNAATQINNAALAIANQVLKDKGYEASTVQSAANFQQQKYNEIEQDIIEKDTEYNSKDLSTSETAEDIAKRFEEAIGKKISWSDNMIQGTDTNRLYAYKGESGEETYTIEYMASVIAAYESQKAMENEAVNIDEQLNNIGDKTSESIERGIKDWVTKEDFTGMKQTSFEEMKGEIGEITTENIEAYFGKLLGDESGQLTDESAMKYGGFESVDEMVASIMQSIQNYDAAVGNVESSMGTEAKEAYGELNFDDMSLQAQQIMANFLENTFKQGGAEGLQLAMDTLKAVGQDQAVEIAKKYAEGFDKEAYASSMNEQFKMEVEDLELPIDELEAYRDLLQKEFPDAYKDNLKGLNEVTIANKRMERGVKGLASNWEDFNDVMSDSNADLEDIAAILPEINDNVQDVLNLSDEEFSLLPPDFAQKNWNLIQDVINDVDGAVDELRNKAGEEILLANAKVNVDINDDGRLDEAFLELHNKIAEFDANQFPVGVPIEVEGQEDFYAACNEMINAAGMTAEQAQAYFASMGYDAEITEVEAPPKETPWHIDNPVLDKEASDLAGVPIFTGKEVLTGTNTSPGGTALAVKVLTPTGSYGGGVGVNKTAPKSATAPAKDTGKKKGGGGGKKEKADKKHVKSDPDQKKQIKDEAERYHEINNELESISRELDKISKAKDRAFGKKRIQLMQEEAKALEKQIGLQKQYLNEIQANMAKDKAALSKYGATFNENDNITNYDEMVEAQVNKYNAAYDAYIAKQNAAIDVYNKSAKEEADDEKHENTLDKIEEDWEAAQKAYEEFQDEIAQYEDSVDLFEESQLTLQDIQNQLYDLKLEEFDYKVQLKLEVEEDSMKLLDFLLNNLKDDAYDAAEAIAILGKQADSAFNNIKAYEKGLNDIFANHGLGSDSVSAFVNGSLTANDLANMDFTEEEVSKIREYRDGLLEESQALLDVQQTVREKVLVAWDDLISKMDTSIGKIEHMSSLMDSYRNIIDIVGKDMLGISDEFMASLDQASYDVALNKMEASATKLEQMRASRDDAQAKLDAARAESNEELAKYWEDTIARMDEDIQSAESDFMSSWEETLQAAADMFANQMETIFNDFSRGLTGAFGGTINELQNALNIQREVNDLYVEDYEKIYKLSKLSRDITKSLDETNNIKGKQGLLAIQEEINKAQAKGVEMSEYEIENLRRKYDLELARIQLDEAKNTKSTVRMSRDNQGNWGYVYTADAEGVAQAEQNYEDKLYAMQQANSDYIKQLEANIIQAQIDMMAAMQEIDATKYANAQDYYKALEEAAAPYYKMMDFYSSQMNTALGNNKSLYENDWKQYSIATGYKISENQKFTDSFNETLLAQLTGFNSMEGYLQNHINNVGSIDNPESLIGKLGKAYEDYATKVNTAMETAGTSVEKFAEDLDTKVNDDSDGIVANSDKAADSVADAAEEMANQFDTILGDVENFESTYGDRISSVVSKNKELAESLNQVIAKWSQLDEETTPTTPTTPPQTTPPSNNNNNNKGNDGGGDGKLTIGETVTYTGGTYYYDSNGTAPSGNRGPGKKVTIESIKEGAKYPIAVKSKDSAYGWLRKDQLKGFDTGGYTGDWGGPHGKLALLHQKELVLNADETKDMLKAVELVREISSMIDLNAMSASIGLSGMLSAGRFHDASTTIQQEVTIHAEFPDVKDRNQIKEAFGDLVNMAAQYANRQR